MLIRAIAKSNKPSEFLARARAREREREKERERERERDGGRMEGGQGVSWNRVLFEERFPFSNRTDCHKRRTESIRELGPPS